MIETSQGQGPRRAGRRSLVFWPDGARHGRLVAQQAAAGHRLLPPRRRGAGIANKFDIEGGLVASGALITPILGHLRSPPSLPRKCRQVLDVRHFRRRTALATALSTRHYGSTSTQPIRLPMPLIFCGGTIFRTR